MFEVWGHLRLQKFFAPRDLPHQKSTKGAENMKEDGRIIVEMKAW